MPHEYFDNTIFDSTIPNPMSGRIGEFEHDVRRMLEHFEWEISRESITKPLHGPIHIIGGKTYEVKWKTIENGASAHPFDPVGFPPGDYLTTDCSEKAQIELLHEIGTRVVHQCIAAKGEDATQLIWGVLPTASRILTARGLLMLIKARFDWV